MATITSRMAAPTSMHSGGAAPANGNSLTLTGAARGLLFCTGSGTLTAGDLTFEESKDGGTIWTAADDVQSFATADGGAEITTLAFGSLPAVIKVGHKRGPRLLRARISTAFAGGTVTVTGVAVGN